MRVALRFLSLVSLLPVMSIVGCGSAGSSPAGQSSSTKEPAGGSEEPGGSGEEPTGPGYEAPGGSSSGSASGSGTSGGAACVACVNYQCTFETAQGSVAASVNLSAGSNGACSDTDDGFTLRCGGGVVEEFDGGTLSVGTWNASAGGGFTLTAGTSMLTCTPN